MIIEIVGQPRAGKTALNTLFMVRELIYSGYTMRRNCEREITSQNESRESNKLTIPRKPPIYANYEAHITTGYKKVFKPYFLNPYRLGIPTPQTADKIQNMPPFSCLHITEGRKYWDGRESSSMPDNVSQFFETHGHNHMTIIIDAQRGDALDLNIRKNVTKFIEVQGMWNDEDAYDRVRYSRWYCREFYSLQDYQAYLVGNRTARYYETTYSYEGNIFEFFESRNRKQDFVPSEGRDYSMLEFVGADELKALPKSVKELYDDSRPEWYRMKANAA